MLKTVQSADAFFVNYLPFTQGGHKSGNMKNSENLKSCQNLRENSGKFDFFVGKPGKLRENVNSLGIGTKETIFYMVVGFIGIVQSLRIFLNSIFNTFPFLYKFESLGFQMQATDKGARVGTGLIQ